jgi:predicted ATPase
MAPPDEESTVQDVRAPHPSRVGTISAHAHPFCACRVTQHGPPKLVVLTGGPGAGKTAVLETIRKYFCEHVHVLPEAAGIVFGGGFPRKPAVPLVRAAQRAIFHVQRELERASMESGEAAVVLCDRGTLDALAYWPGDPADFWHDVRSTVEEELARYAAVIHLRTPSANNGYDHSNPLRIESALEAAAIDRRIFEAWSGHPRRTIVESDANFLSKMGRAVAQVREEVPECCRSHRVPQVDDAPLVQPAKAPQLPPR